MKTQKLNIKYVYISGQILRSKKKDEIRLPNLQLNHNDSFLHVLKYIYTGKLTLKNPGEDRIDDLMYISQTLNLISLIEEFTRLLELTPRDIITTVSNDCSIKLLNADTGETIRTLTGHGSLVWSLKFLTNNRLASGSWDGTILIWNLETSKCEGNLTGHKKHVSSLQLQANNRLASGSWDKSIKIWNVDTGECIRTLTNDYFEVISLQMLAKSKLASGSKEGSIKIWNIDTGECIRTLKTGYTSGMMPL